MKRSANEGEVGGGFAEMEDDAPVELEPAEVGLQDGAVSGIDAVVERWTSTARVSLMTKLDIATPG